METQNYTHAQLEYKDYKQGKQNCSKEMFITQCHAKDQTKKYMEVKRKADPFVRQAVLM